MLPCVRFNNSTTSEATAPAPTTTHVGAYCGFFKLTTDTNAFTSIFQVREGGGGDGDQFSCGTTGTNLLFIDYPTTGEIAVANLDVGRWYFAGLNRRSTSIEIFLGIPGMPGWVTRVFDATLGTFTPTVVSWGCWNSLGDTLNGCVAGWRYWIDRSLSSAQFADEMTSLRAVDRAGLWGEWVFPGKRGLDTSGRNNHATFGAGTITEEIGPAGVLPLKRKRRGGAVVSAPPPATGTQRWWMATAA